MKKFFLLASLLLLFGYNNKVYGVSVKKVPKRHFTPTKKEVTAQVMGLFKIYNSNPDRSQVLYELLNYLNANKKNKNMTLLHKGTIYSWIGQIYFSKAAKLMKKLNLRKALKYLKKSCKYYQLTDLCFMNNTNLAKKALVYKQNVCDYWVKNVENRLRFPKKHVPYVPKYTMKKAEVNKQVDKLYTMYISDSNRDRTLLYMKRFMSINYQNKNITPSQRVKIYGWIGDIYYSQALTLHRESKFRKSVKYYNFACTYFTAAERSLRNSKNISEEEAILVRNKVCTNYPANGYGMILSRRNSSNNKHLRVLYKKLKAFNVNKTYKYVTELQRGIIHALIGKIYLSEAAHNYNYSNISKSLKYHKYSCYYYGMAELLLSHSRNLAKKVIKYRKMVCNSLARRSKNLLFKKITVPIIHSR